MRTPLVVGSLLVALGGCGARTGLGVGEESAVATPDAQPIETCDWVKEGPQRELVFATDLEYPKGLWITGCRIYFTETAGRNSGTRGKVSLGMYDLVTRERRVLVDNPRNCDAIAADGSGRVFLASPDVENTTSVTVVEPTTLVESPVASVPIQVVGLAMSKTGDLFLTGNDTPAVGPSARSLFRLPVGRYGEPALLASGLGLPRCMAELDGNVYVASTLTGTPESFGLTRVSPDGAKTRLVSTGWGTNSMSLSRKWLYGADDGGIWRERLTELRSPEVLPTSVPPKTAVAVRYEAALNVLVYLDRGTPTSDGKYQSGALRMLTRVE